MSALTDSAAGGAGWNPIRFLSLQEWQIAWKVAATAAMLLALLLRTIYADLPAEAFIYGRF